MEEIIASIKDTKLTPAERNAFEQFLQNEFFASSLEKMIFGVKVATFGEKDPYKVATAEGWVNAFLHILDQMRQSRKTTKTDLLTGEVH